MAPHVAAKAGAGSAFPLCAALAIGGTRPAHSRREPACAAAAAIIKHADVTAATVTIAAARAAATCGIGRHDSFTTGLDSTAATTTGCKQRPVGPAAG